MNSYEAFNSFCIGLVKKWSSAEKEKAGKGKVLSQKKRNEENEANAELIQVELSDAFITEENNVQALKNFSAYLVLFCVNEISYFGTDFQHAFEEVVNVLDNICSLLSAFVQNSDFGDPTELQKYSFFNNDEFEEEIRSNSLVAVTKEVTKDVESGGSEEGSEVEEKSLAAVTKGLKWILTFYLPIAARLILDKASEAARLILDKASEAAAASRRSASASQCVIFLQWHSYLCGLMVSK